VGELHGNPYRYRFDHYDKSTEAISDDTR